MATLAASTPLSYYFFVLRTPVVPARGVAEH